MLILSSNHNTQNYPNPFGLGLGLWLCWSWYSFRQVGLLWCLGDAHAWLENYLCGHQQAVKFDDSLSAWGSVKVGVPQGSILGPPYCFLFLWMTCQMWWLMHKLTCMLITLSYIVVVRNYGIFRRIFSLTSAGLGTGLAAGQQTAIKCFNICDYVNWFLAEVAG